MAARQDARCVTTVYLLLHPENPKGLGLINQMKNAYPQRMQALLLDAARVFPAGKRSEGKVSLPLCSLTIWYYRYALTRRIAKPDPTHAWHLELNTSLGTTTRNQPNQFGASSTIQSGSEEEGWYEATCGSDLFSGIGS